jgi:hypothetical protein
MNREGLEKFIEKDKILRPYEFQEETGKDVENLREGILRKAFRGEL